VPIGFKIVSLGSFFKASFGTGGLANYLKNSLLIP